jgi:hypothetical protein
VLAAPLWRARYAACSTWIEFSIHQAGTMKYLGRPSGSLRWRVELTEAVTYRVLEPEPAEVTPSEEYVRALVAAARELRLPTSYVHNFMRLQRRLAGA